MTTSVTIRHDGPDHMDVLVEAVTPSGAVNDAQRLATGEQATYYVYDNQSVRVTEVAKENPVKRVAQYLGDVPPPYIPEGSPTLSLH